MSQINYNREIFEQIESAIEEVPKLKQTVSAMYMHDIIGDDVDPAHIGRCMSVMSGEDGNSIGERVTSSTNAITKYEVIR